MTTAQVARRANLRTCESYISERCLKWLGHVARMPDDRLPRQTLFARVRGPRAIGGQQMTTRARLHKLVSSIPAVLEEKGQHDLTFKWAVAVVLRLEKFKNIVHVISVFIRLIRHLERMVGYSVCV